MSEKLPDYSVEYMESRRIARFKKFKPHGASYLDNALPEYKREIFNVIGRGVQENKDATAEIKDPEGFNVAIAKCEPGTGGGLHSHTTVEVFMPMDGTFKILWGEEGENSVVLEKFDFISVPVGILRSFTNVGISTAHLLTILGGTDAGRLRWGKKLIADAKSRGWEIAADGNLVIAEKN